MSSPIAKEPLKDFIEKIKPKKRKQSKESSVLLIILALFILGSIVNLSPRFIGFVTLEKNTETIEINEIYINSTEVALFLKGNITSFRMTGQFIGNGTAKIYLGEKLIADSSLLERDSGNMITGFVVDEQIEEEINSTNMIEDSESVDLEIIDDTTEDAIDLDTGENNTEGNTEESTEGVANVTILQDETVGIEEDISQNLQLNETDEQNISLNITQQITENISQAINGSDIPLVNITLNNTGPEENITQDSENITGAFNITETNETFDELMNTSYNLLQNISDEILEYAISQFENYCLETCSLSGIGKNITLRIDLNDMTLNLSSITYTYAEAENITAIPSNETINYTLLEKAILSENYSYVEINKPVEWVRIVNTSIINKTILPKDAFNISVEKNAKVKVDETEYGLEEYNEIALSRELEKEIKRLQKPVKEKYALEVYEKVTSLSKRIIAMGASEVITSDNITLEFESAIETLELRYYTDGPSVEEKEYGKYKKQLVVSSDIHYKNVLTYTDITESRRDSIKVHWLINGTKTRLEAFEYFDTNNNGLIDKLQWITPHLSNQTFEISITVLNPYEYLRDGETWVVAFNTTGIGNLTISSPNANWTEFFFDDSETDDEMRFLNLSCGSSSLVSNLKLIDFESNHHYYQNLSELDSVKSKKLRIENYECNSTGYLSNYMNIAGYATLLFEFSNQNMTVSDFAYDPDEFVVKTLNFSDTTRNKAYMRSNATNQVSNVSIGHFATDTNPTGSEGRNGSQVKVAGYTALANDDSSYLNVSGRGATKTEPFARFNFSTNASPSLVNWIYVSMDQKRVQASGNGENCYYWIFNYTKNDWIIFGANTSSTTDVTRSYNFTAGVLDLMNLSHQIMVMSHGVDMDANEGCLIDFVQVKIGYYNNSLPTHSTPTITPSYPSITSNLTCNWQSVSDADGDIVKNITNWYKNGKSITKLYIPFEGNGLESQVAFDYSSNWNQGSVSGATWNRTGGKVGGAYKFDGTDDYIEVNYNSNLNTSYALTLSAWVKLKETNQAGQYNYLLSKRYSYHFHEEQLSSEIEAYLRTDGGHRYCSFSASKNLSLNTWYFLVLTYNSSTGGMKTYKNGVLNTTCSITGAVNITNSNLYIGSVYYGGDSFNGTIDEVKIYNYSLSSNQIYIEYLSGLANKTSNRVSYNDTKLGEQWFCSVTPNDGYADGQTKNSTGVTISSNTAPNITAPILRPSYTNTSSNIQCNATADDAEQSSLTVYWYWYNSTAIKLSGTKSVTAEVNTLITTLGSGNTTRGERWNCTVVPYDGTLYGLNKTARIPINNSVPTHGTPTVIPSAPNTTSNLTCNWISVSDADSDRVVNITNWYRNNKSITVLNMPFEGNGNESKNATDYSGYRNKGTVFGAIYNRTGGKIGGAYRFDGVDDYIDLPDNSILDIYSNSKLTILVWIYPRSTGEAGFAKIVDKASSPTDGVGEGYSFRVEDQAGNQIELAAKIAHDSTDAVVRSSTTMTINQWHLVAMVYNESSDEKIKLYIDGSLASLNQDTAGSGALSDDTAIVTRIGNLAGSTERTFDGSIDEVRIFNISLSLNQIMNIFNAENRSRNSRSIVFNQTSLGEQWHCSVTPNDGYKDGQTKNSTRVTIAANTVPNITAPISRPSYTNTSSNIQCNATADDAEQSSLTVYWYWYNSTSIKVSGTTGVTAGVNTLITTLGAGNTTRGERWNCTVKPYDGTLYGTNRTARIAINNSFPIQGTPTITPSSPNITSNLTCNWVSVSDADSDRVVNITNWYRNNKSITLLYLPFEGGSNSTYAKDYSGYRNNGNVSGATFNRSNGMVGGSYYFDGVNDKIQIWDLDLKGNYSILFWTKRKELTSEWQTYVMKEGDYGCESLGTDFYCHVRNGAPWETTSYTMSIANAWYHVASVYNGTTLILYINGTVVDTETAPAHTQNDDSLKIGAYSYASEFLNGTIDQVYIFNTSLSQDQIRHIYEQEKTGRSVQKLASDEIVLSEQWHCSVTPNDGYADGQTKNSSRVTISNIAPTITTPTFLPSIVNTSSNIQCYTTATDLESNSLTVYWYWFNSTKLKLNGTTSVTSGVSTLITTLGAGNTTKNENWNCTVKPYDGSLYGTNKTGMKSIINIGPTAPSLLIPTAGNTTVHNRNTYFDWSTSSDIDNDAINYTLNITSGFCSNLYFGNITTSYFYSTSELCLSNIYYWQVRSSDGSNRSTWSTRRNFTLEPIIVLNLTTSTIGFGNISNGETKDTDLNASPLIVRNDGNIRLNISYVSAASSLFSTLGLNTAYFQFKIDNDTTESNSFNWTASQTTWTNITSIAVQNKSAIAHLKYQNSQDTAEIDIKVTVPTNEGAGRKSAIVYIIGDSP